MLRNRVSRFRFDWGLVWTLLVTLPVTLPLWRPGYLDTHDGTLHLYRVMAIDRAIHQGVPFPRWLPEMSFDYGYPLLNYYPPLSYYVAETFHLLGAGYIAGIKLAFALAFVLAAGTMYLLAREFFGRWPAVLAAAIYTYLPYHLADTYMRGAIGESWAFVFLPLLFWSLYRLRQSQSLPPALIVSIGLAGLVLAHNLTAFVFVPFLLLYVLYGAVRSRNLKDIILPAGSFVLGLSLSAFYWLPAMLEVKAVHVGDEGTNIILYERFLTSISDWLSFFLPYRYYPDQGLLSEHPLSIVQLAFIALGAVALFLWRKRRHTEPFGHTAFFLFFAGASCFMQLSFSRFLWEGLPTLKYLQFPWRFLTFTAIASSFAVAAVVAPREKENNFAQSSSIRKRKPATDSMDNAITVETLLQDVSADVERAKMTPIQRMDSVVHTTSSLDGAEKPKDQGEARQSYAMAQNNGGPICRMRHLWWRWALGIVAIAVLLLTAWPNLPLKTLEIAEQDVTQHAMSDHDAKNEQIGASWAGEYVPIDVVEGRDQIPRPPVDSRPVASSLPDGVKLNIGKQSPWEKLYKVTSLTETRLRLHGFYFPGWKAFVDGRETPTFPDTRLGLLAFDVPAGSHDLTLRFTDTTLRSIGNWLSALGLTLVIVALVAIRRYRLGILVVAGVVVFAFLLLWQGREGSRFQSPRQINAQFGQTATLLGFSSDKPSYKAGETAEITLYWLSRSDPQQDLHVFVHVTPPDDESRKVGQNDGVPVGGYTPTSRWYAGEIIEDRRQVTIGAGTPPGVYKVMTGLYDPVTVQNLTATDSNDLPLGPRVYLGDLAIGE